MGLRTLFNEKNNAQPGNSKVMLNLLSMKNFSLYSALLVGVLLFLSPNCFGQSINAPEAAGNPNVPGSTAWTAACASETFNTYYVNASWNPPFVNSDNQFILELSDANGDFSSPVSLDTIANDNVDFELTFEIAIPEDTRGEGYTMRVRSTSPALTGEASAPYAMYYIGYRNPILISRDRSGTIPPGGTINSCSGESVVLAAHNVPDFENYDYTWYRDNQPISEKSSSLTVTQEGTYAVEIDYGASCSGSANTLSNNITVTFGTAVGVSISALTSTAICNGQSVVLEASINDANLTYTWLKDNTPVTSPTLGDFQFTVDGAVTNFAGDYAVRIEGNGACTETSNAIAVTNAGAFDVTLDTTEDIQLLPNGSASLTASTNASNPSFQWYLNNSPIAGATNASFTITEEGSYFVRVSASGACASSQIDSDTIEAILPDDFEITITIVGEYTACSSTQANLAVATITAVYGADTVDVTASLQNDFTYQWELNNNAVSGETTSSIIVTDLANNGLYTLSASITDYTVLTNSIELQLGTGETLEITSTGTSLCDGDILELATTTDLSGEIFEWTLDDVIINTTDATVTIDETGVYQLILYKDNCPLQSNSITVTPFDDSAITIDQGTDFLIVSGTTVTVTASGASTYEWFSEDNQSLGTGEQFDVTEPGAYLLVASSDNCSTTIAFTANLREDFEVPNVITPNGDGINDIWLLPNTYSGRESVEVTIYDSSGVEVLRQTNYQNNWPEATMAFFPNQNIVFYYTIEESGNAVKQGTITVIK